MVRVVKIEIAEEAETLKKLLVQQKDKRTFERVQALYLLKIRQVETVEHLAIILGRGRRTIQRWLSQYRSGGLAKMLEVGSSPGKEPLIPEWAVERLKVELSEERRFYQLQRSQNLARSSVGYKSQIRCRTSPST
jgi:putative transposase